MNSTALWYTTRATGIVTLVLLTATMFLGLATTNRTKARHWPGFAQQEIHRRISLLAVVFLGIHVLTSILDTFVSISPAALIIPFTSSYDRLWVGIGTISLDLMLAVGVTSMLRSHMKPGTWRGVHWLAYLSWPLALAHTYGMGTDAGETWMIVLGALCVGLVAGGLMWRIRVTSRQNRARSSIAATAGTHVVHAVAATGVAPHA